MILEKDIRNSLSLRSCRLRSSSTSTFSGSDVRPSCLSWLSKSCLSQLSKYNPNCFLMTFAAPLTNQFWTEKKKRSSVEKNIKSHFVFIDSPFRRQLCGQPSNICASSLRIQTGYNQSWFRRFGKMQFGLEIVKKNLFNFRCSVNTGTPLSPFSSSVTEGDSHFSLLIQSISDQSPGRISERSRQLSPRE